MRFYMVDGGLTGLGTAAYEETNAAAVKHGRPVVVIDPEDREAVGELVDAYVRNMAAGGPVLNMQAALREFADPKPPKPEEPTGLGAVVEDVHGGLWTRFHDFHDGEHWASNSMESNSTYARIDAVRVLSEGVQA